jgi:hypothetical protein
MKAYEEVAEFIADKAPDAAETLGITVGINVRSLPDYPYLAPVPAKRFANVIVGAKKM